MTFFRNRPRVAENNPSAFAPRQLLFAHAAIADPRHGKLRHDQRGARSGLGLADAVVTTTDVRIGDWSLRFADGRYVARIAAQDFRFDLRFTPTQDIMLEGDQGFSRKGQDPASASYYYSQPHLAVEGDIGIEGRTAEVKGTAWLDHEWSSEAMAPGAIGWDWIGINLHDGGSLMAFRMRDRTGNLSGPAARCARQVVPRPRSDRATSSSRPNVDGVHPAPAWSIRCRCMSVSAATTTPSSR